MPHLFLIPSVSCMENTDAVRPLGLYSTSVPLCTCSWGCHTGRIQQKAGRRAGGLLVSLL
jgi:hypothetical protein